MSGVVFFLAHSQSDLVTLSVWQHLYEESKSDNPRGEIVFAGPESHHVRGKASSRNLRGWESKYSILTYHMKSWGQNVCNRGDFRHRSSLDKTQPSRWTLLEWWQPSYITPIVFLDATSSSQEVLKKAFWFTVWIAPERLVAATGWGFLRGQLCQVWIISTLV